MAGMKIFIPCKTYKSKYFKLDDALFIKFRQAYKKIIPLNFLKKMNT